jgi:hypothetical protein
MKPQSTTFIPKSGSMILDRAARTSPSRDCTGAGGEELDLGTTLARLGRGAALRRLATPAAGGGGAPVEPLGRRWTPPMSDDGAMEGAILALVRIIVCVTASAAEFSQSRCARQQVLSQCEPPTGRDVAWPCVLRLIDGDAIQLVRSSLMSALGV